MFRRQEVANNGNHPEAQPQQRCSCSRKTKLIILATVCVNLLVVIILILVFVNFNAGTPFSTAEQKELVDAHNMYRSTVTPPAKDMQKMVWDNDIAKWAQKWADKCTLGHGDLESERGTMGQNVAGSFPRMKDMGPAAVKFLWSEVKDYNYKDNSCNSTQGCGHYTQVVWATSNKLGCGRSAEGCYEGELTLVVCNYYPPGNWPTWPYKT